MHRTTTKEYTLPNGAIIPEKTGVVIPTLAIHRDPEYFEDPLKFNPDRFSDENKKMRHPFAYIPFGEGEINSEINYAKLQNSYLICHRSANLHWNALWTFTN